MASNINLDEILKSLSDNKSNLQALYSLYNTVLLQADSNRNSLIDYYEQMINMNNELKTIARDISALKKKERGDALNKSKSKINSMSKDADKLNTDFKSAYTEYSSALANCSSLKTQYKHNVSEKCKEFKANSEEADSFQIKKYQQSVKTIKLILGKIEYLIADYNVKKNRTAEDSEVFTKMYLNVKELINQLATAS